MRAITVRQPWAWAIVHGGKDVENRSRNIAGAYRGPVAIHAGLRADEEVLRALPGKPPNGIPRIFYYGAFIGVVDLVDVHGDAECYERDVHRLCQMFREDPASISRFPDNGLGGILGKARMCSTWAQGDAHHLILTNPRPLANPIPARGRLGLWTVPDEIEQQVTKGLT